MIEPVPLNRMGRTWMDRIDFLQENTLLLKEMMQTFSVTMKEAERISRMASTGKEDGVSYNIVDSINVYLRQLQATLTQLERGIVTRQKSHEFINLENAPEGILPAFTAWVDRISNMIQEMKKNLDGLQLDILLMPNSSDQDSANDYDLIQKFLFDYWLREVIQDIDALEADIPIIQMTLQELEKPVVPRDQRS